MHFRGRFSCPLRCVQFLGELPTVVRQPNGAARLDHFRRQSLENPGYISSDLGDGRIYLFYEPWKLTCSMINLRQLSNECPDDSQRSHACKQANRTQLIGHRISVVYGRREGSGLGIVPDRRID